VAEIPTPRRLAAMLVVAIAALVHLGTPPAVDAHALAPALFEMVVDTPGQFEVLWRRPYVGVPGVTLEPVVPAHCRPIDTPREEPGDVTMDTRWRVDCGQAGLVGKEIDVAGIEETETDALIRVSLADGTTAIGIVRAGTPPLTVPARPSGWKVLRDYGSLGVEHILLGFDHLLLVLCLLWLVPGLRMLLAVLTAFTVGHTATLFLAMFSVLPVSQAVVDVTIAASVLALAVEAASDRPSRWVGRQPWAVAGAFGLLHGLGFAGALREIGLPAAQVPLALVSFNVGIEAGQILFVAAAGSVLAAARRASLPLWVENAPVFVTGCLAAMWTIERAVALW
jgi:hypothetical protein